MWWTTTKPTKPGWYWYRTHADVDHYVAQVCKRADGALYFDYDHVVSECHGQWSSEPLTSPTHE